MEQKNPILNFRKRNLDKKGKNINSQKNAHASMITKTRESIDMTENS